MFELPSHAFEEICGKPHEEAKSSIEPKQPKSRKRRGNAVQLYAGLDAQLAA
jgi:hypothetical protein